MFWGDILVEELKKKKAKEIREGKPLVVRDEKTASGRVHVGSTRSFALHGIVSEILTEQKIPHTFLYEINDFDAMDGLPVYLDQEIYRPYMGRQLYKIPSPDNKALNYAEYFAEEYRSILEGIGFHPEFYRSSEIYKSGRYNQVIRIALEQAVEIRKLYKEISHSEKPDDWLPLQVACQNCGKIGTTKVTSFDGAMVTYVCMPKLVEWAEGCEHEGNISPFDGNAKLPWKVEWAAKFVVFGVDAEGGGKDHYTKGGARDLANAICREVYKQEPPFDMPHEFILVGGKKMSSSKGAGLSAKELFDLLPTEIFRLFLIRSDIKKTIDFVPDGDTVPILFDTYDKFADGYFGRNEKVLEDEKRIFFLSHPEEVRKNLTEHFLPRFSQIVFLVQMPHMDIKDEIEKLKGLPLTDLDIVEIEKRVKYAKYWLATYAPEDYKFEIQPEVPEKTKLFTAEQKKALTEVRDYITQNPVLDGLALHTEIHEIRKRSGLEAKDFFQTIYVSVLGKESGPKVGWFLSVLARDFLIKRFTEVID
jgi:lysyl-tRNA synthetase class 1